ncbi:MAG: dihydroneopterin aldolase [archaeon]|nr:dihydroneopterin aldolase [archaeon]MDA1168094.1 dihydroneopterin aldolase [archaeon]
MRTSVGLDAYEVHAIHGYFDEEHTNTQPFIVSVKVTLVDGLNVSDLGHTIDYGRFQSIVDEVFLQSQPIRLLELLANAIIEHLKDESHISEIWIRIEKPNAPLPHPGGLPYIEVLWQNQNQT